jgi:hypothetical protein
MHQAAGISHTHSSVCSAVTAVVVFMTAPVVIYLVNIDLLLIHRSVLEGVGGGCSRFQSVIISDNNNTKKYNNSITLSNHGVLCHW